MNGAHATRRCRARWITPALIAAAGTLAPASALAIPSQTFVDPVGGTPVPGTPLPDNCRTYTTPPADICAPDVTQVVFSTPGDGNLHIDITYASLPTVFGFPSSVEHVEVGLYPKAATTVDLSWDRRVSKFGSSFSVNKPPTAHAPVLANLRPLGIKLVVPLTAIGGDPTVWRYVVNAGNVGEVVPEHAELVPNTGFIDLAGDPAPPPPPSPPPAPPPTPPAPPVPLEPPVTPAMLKALIGPLTGIVPVQRGPALAGQVTLKDGADALTVEALVRPATLRPPAAGAAPAPLTRIGIFTKRNVQAGKLAFRVPLSRAIRAKLALRPTSAITLRVTLRVGQTKGSRTKQVVWKRPVRRP